ncbi:MAG TPA: sigma-70 family RNA polymerase sigma factor [Streptosporangiaceae bacterium]
MSGLADDPVRAPDSYTEDDLLLHRLRSGDEQAFDRLVRTWSPAMRRMARGFVSTDASAQECVQDAWLGVIKGLASFEGRSTLRTWAFRILVNTAKTRAVREQRTTPLSSLAADDEAGPTVDPGRFRPRDDPERPGTWTSAGEPRPWETDPETGALSGELRDVVSAAVEALPARQREVVVLRDIQGFGSEEACQILGLTAQNQRVLLHRGRARVRAALEAYYAGESR